MHSRIPDERVGVFIDGLMGKISSKLEAGSLHKRATTGGPYIPYRRDGVLRSTHR